MKKLPLGYQDFKKIREENKLYIDKTELIWQFISEGEVYFLSRPRRFGKSLLISTLEYFFRGKKELFEGLAISKKDYDWQTYPVISLKMNSLSTESLREVNSSLIQELGYIAKRYKVELINSKNAPSVFKDLIEKLHEFGPVVVLIDEYDKPLLDQLGGENENGKDKKQRLIRAKGFQRFLKSFYGKLKPADSMLKFVFITGVSKFTKTSIFSELNHLTDLTMSENYADLLGYTEAELYTNFSEHIQKLENKLGLEGAVLKSYIRSWYNGFQLSEKPVKVYNPYSILSLFFHEKFGNYWFETGTPTFLINLIKDKGFPQELFTGLKTNREAFATWDIDNLDLWPLMFQTGYLTIKNVFPMPGRPLQSMYELDFPNQEIQQSMMDYLLNSLSGKHFSATAKIVFDLTRFLMENKLEDFFKLVKSLFANISYELHIEDEHYYQSLFAVLFTLMNMKPRTEEQTSQGRIDMIVDTPDRIFIFEFKLNKPAKKALDQIHEKKYYEKFLYLKKPIFLVGVAIDSEKREIKEWLVEEK